MKGGKKFPVRCAHLDSDLKQCTNMTLFFFTYFGDPEIYKVYEENQPSAVSIPLCVKHSLEV